MGSGQAHALTLYYIMIIYTVANRIHNKTEIELKLWVKISAIKLKWLTCTWYHPEFLFHSTLLFICLSASYNTLYIHIHT